ncbi:MAG TPA: 50S ribosomal protein L7/L12 [Actinomycetota bacterium]|jgi:large subunit ribosomal protein L7/L12|nr:50S ribosomal protein L7/L12 [Actinomycetota bacterium]
MAKVDDVLTAIKELSVLEAAELAKMMQEEFGIEAAAPVAVAAAGAPAGGDGAAAAEEKDEFDVILTAPGDKKIQVIKEIRSFTTLGLKEAKDVADSAPKPIKEKVTKDEAQKIKEAIEAAGGTVEIK